MKTCNCTLNLTNPEACESCSINFEYDSAQWIPDTGTPYVPYKPYPPTTTPVNYPQIQKVKKITRTIEKYDKHGNYKGKEIIIEEEEIFDKEYYPPSPIYVYPYITGDPVWIQDETYTIGNNDTCCIN